MKIKVLSTVVFLLFTASGCASKLVAESARRPASDSKQIDYNAETGILAVRVHESTTGNKNYALDGGCFNTVPQQCFFRVIALSQSIFDSPEENDVRINMRDPLTRVRVSYSVGWLFAPAASIQGLGQPPKAGAPTLMQFLSSGLGNTATINILGDNESLYRFSIPIVRQ